LNQHTIPNKEIAMSAHSTLLERNRQLAETFEHAEMRAFPKMNTMVLTCVDPRIDPAHILGVELGDALVVRNNGGRVTPAFIDELAALAAMVKKMTGSTEDPQFSVILMQHTQCGAESFANPEFAAALKASIDVDVSASAITDQNTDLLKDIDRLKASEKVPGSITVSAVLYDVKTGLAQEIAPPQTLDTLRS
jgi:carbonic anhydrase